MNHPFIRGELTKLSDLNNGRATREQTGQPKLDEAEQHNGVPTVNTQRVNYGKMSLPEKYGK